MKESKNLPFDIIKSDSNKPTVPAKKKSAVEKQMDFINLVYTKNPVGAPRMYATKEELEEQIIEYFKYCYENSIKLTISGLPLFCGFANRRSFYDYELKPEFAYTIKKARAMIEMHYEGLLQEAFPQGAVFALKNLGWNAEEKIETTNKTKTEFYIGGDDDEETQSYDDYTEVE
jgi:hypothetical protein